MSGEGTTTVNVVNVAENERMRKAVDEIVTPVLLEIFYLATQGHPQSLKRITILANQGIEAIAVARGI